MATNLTPLSTDSLPLKDSLHRRLGKLTHLTAPIRIKTRTVELKSGFEYTRILFDLGIDPGSWDDFSADVKRASKLNGRDEAAIISTITGLSLVGLACIGGFYGERVREKRALKRIMVNRSEGGLLAQVLDSWNERYFSRFGVKAWIEVNEAALRQLAKKRGEDAPDFVRPRRSFKEKTPLVAFDNQLWKRRDEEKKYMVVLEPLEDLAESHETRDTASSLRLVDLSNEPLLQPRDENPFADPLYETKLKLI